MRGWFTALCTASCSRTTAQVRGAVEGRVVGRGEETCGVVSGRFLARSCVVLYGHERLSVIFSAPLDQERWHLWCIAVGWSVDIDWCCLAATDNTQGSVELPHELIARLAAIPGDLVLDLYTGEDQP
jgi:hypothetical protein